MEKENKKKKSAFGKTIVFCPICKSTNIIKKMAPMALPHIGAFAPINLCKDCGFQDTIFPEINEDDENKIEKLKKIFRRKK
jgi:C4-type Zn-finger protein